MFLERQCQKDVSKKQATVKFPWEPKPGKQKHGGETGKSGSAPAYSDSNS